VRYDLERCGYVVTMWFDTWPEVARVAGAAAAAYVSLIVVLRMSGKRTLATLNAFDFVVTVALGSVVATIALSAEVAVVEGLAAFVVLIGLQFVVAWSVARHDMVRSGVKSRAVTLVRDGQLLHDAIKAERLHPEEIHQAVRRSGVGGLELVAAVVAETDGTLSVVTRDQAGSGSALVEQRPGEQQPGD
jgi:uncharacterized membrane protein YcaP (DUF421 family)